MKTIRRLFTAIALATAVLFSPAQGASYSTDQSDLWWIPSESGWGIQFVQRNSTIFATMFVYDPSSAPTWYVATMLADGLTWTGDLYATRGPWFGTAPFDPAKVDGTKVGIMNWSPSTLDAGMLTYTVNGMQVTKNLQREFIAVDDFSGDYGGNLHQTNTGCSDASQNITTDVPAALAIRQNENQVNFAIADVSLNVCSYVGMVSQTGQLGRIASTFTCTDGRHGNLNILELQVNISGITGRFTSQDMPSGCTATGWLGAGRATTF